MTYSTLQEIQSSFVYELIANGEDYKEAILSTQDEISRLNGEIKASKANPSLEYPEGDALNDIATLEKDINALREGERVEGLREAKRDELIKAIASEDLPLHVPIHEVLCVPLALSRVSMDVVGDNRTVVSWKVLISHEVAKLEKAKGGLTFNQWGRKMAYDAKLRYLKEDLARINAIQTRDEHADIAIRGITVRYVANALKQVESERPTLDTLAIFVLAEFVGLDIDTPFLRLYDARVGARNLLLGYGYEGGEAESFILSLMQDIGYVNSELPKSEG